MTVHWWSDDPTENLFMEITNRSDMGTDLKAPRTARHGALTPGYSLIEAVRLGDLVVHYSSTAEAIVGVSLVAGPTEPAPIFWAARGSYARQAGEGPRWLPGTRVPLERFTPLPTPISLENLRQSEDEIMAIRADLEQQFPGHSLYFPWTPYSGGPMRTFQSYLVKFPRAVLFQLSALQQTISALSDEAAKDTDVSDTGITEEAIASAAGKSRQRGGQGLQHDQAIKAAVEARAMDVAIEHWTARGTVKDVHGNESYDLCCQIGDDEVHVEVKGTTGTGAEVFLTANEVAHARTHPHVCLFVVSEIVVTRHPTGVVEATGGSSSVFHPWQIDEGTLAPMAFRYTVPSSE